MKHYVTEARQARKRKGYLVPIKGSELEGQIVRGWKYVPLDNLDYSQRETIRCNRGRFIPSYYKKIRVWSCVYCGQESRYLAVFHYAGHDVMERLCNNCVKIHGPISVPVSI